MFFMVVFFITERHVPENLRGRLFGFRLLSSRYKQEGQDNSGRTHDEVFRPNVIFHRLSLGKLQELISPGYRVAGGQYD